MILTCLLEGGRTVSEIEVSTGIGQPALSQQLAELRRAEMVKTRRASKQVYYELADENVALCVRTMEGMFGAAPDTAAALRSALQPRMSARAAAKPAAGAAAFARIGSVSARDCYPRRLIAGTLFVSVR